MASRRVGGGEPTSSAVGGLLKRALPVADRLLRFGLTGIASLGVCVGLTVVMHEWFGWAEELSFAMALVLTYVANFLSCRYLVFVGGGGQPGSQLLAYGLASLVFRGLEFGGFLVLHSWIGVPYVLAAIAVKVLAFVVKFLFYGRFVFNDPVLGGLRRDPPVGDREEP